MGRKPPLSEYQSCEQTEEEINGTFGVCALLIGRSFGYGDTKFVRTAADALIAFSKCCEYPRDFYWSAATKVELIVL
jgi:hypothetical protein